MANLIPQEQAAAMLGISVEKLTELRSKNEIFGYKDGNTWKFKMQEIQRVADELGLTLNPNAAGPMSTGDSSSSEAVDSEGLDDLILESSGDELILDDSGDALSLDESGEVTDEEALSFGSSSLKLAGSSKRLVDEGDILSDDQPSGKDSPSDTGKMLGGGDDDFIMSEEDLFSDDMSLQDSYEDSAELSSDFEDSELILDDSDSSSELAMGGEGVSLAPNESGISLDDDDALELGGSDVDALELPDDDDMIVLDEAADPEEATMMQDDDFNLTPLEMAMDDDTSGSQIIALEDSEIYTDETSATILADSDDLEAQPALLDDSSLATDAMYGQAAGAGMTMPGGPVMGTAPALPEAPFTLAQILGLALVLAILLPGAMVAYDLARNMWLPEDKLVSSGFVLDFFLNITGMK